MEKAPVTVERKYLKLGNRLAITFSILSVLAVLVTAAVLFLNFRNQIRQDIRQRLLNIISIVALQQDGDLHATIVAPKDKESEAYKTLTASNVAMLKTEPELVFFFSMRQNEQGEIYFVLDNSADPTYESLVVGTVYEEPTDLLRNNFAALDHAIVEEDTYTDEFGTFLSAYAPIYRSDGTREGIIGVDIDASTVVAREREFLVLSIVAVLVSIPFVALFGWILGTQLARPISNLAEAARAMAGGNLAQRVAITPNSQEVYELANDFNSMAGRLQDFVSNLEQRVAERTQELQLRTTDLETLSAVTQERARKLRAIAEVARSIAQVQNLDRLLPAVVTVVSQEFGYYHVGIFLNDSNNQNAVLRAANSAGGQKMLERGHRLQIGQVGLVGNVAATGRARIALDTGEDAVFFSNPDLPGTRSEIAIPLRTGRDTIGVLDVQSDAPNAFDQTDVELLTILADQISTAIQNTRLFAETQRALSESENVARQYIRNQWRDISAQGELPGVRYDGMNISMIPGGVRSPASKTGPLTGTLAVPVKIRGEVIGTIHVRADEHSTWDEDDIDIAEAVAERVAIAIENARLLSESQRRAVKEQTIGQISTKLSASVNIENIVRTALQELGQVIPGSEIFLEFEQDNNS